MPHYACSRYWSLHIKRTETRRYYVFVSRRKRKTERRIFTPAIFAKSRKKKLTQSRREKGRYIGHPVRINTRDSSSAKHFKYSLPSGHVSWGGTNYVTENSGRERNPARTGDEWRPTEWEPAAHIEQNARAARNTNDRAILKCWLATGPERNRTANGDSSFHFRSTRRV